MVVLKFGSPSWARTSDLRINSPSLYRLSYRGKEARILERRRQIVNENFVQRRKKVRKKFN